MQRVISTAKFRDKNGKIIGYKIQSDKGEVREVKAEELKKAIMSKKIEVLNLTLTSDGRLVDKPIKVKAQAEAKKVNLKDLQKNWLGKIADTISWAMTNSESSLTGKDRLIFTTQQIEPAEIDSLIISQIDGMAEEIVDCFGLDADNIVDIVNGDFDDYDEMYDDGFDLQSELVNWSSDGRFCWVISGDIKTKKVTVGLGIETQRAEKFTRTAVIKTEQDLKTFLIMLRRMWEDYKDEEKEYKKNNDTCDIIKTLWEKASGEELEIDDDEEDEDDW